MSSPQEIAQRYRGRSKAGAALVAQSFNDWNSVGERSRGNMTYSSYEQVTQERPRRAESYATKLCTCMTARKFEGWRVSQAA